MAVCWCQLQSLPVRMFLVARRQSYLMTKLEILDLILRHLVWLLSINCLIKKNPQALRIWRIMQILVWFERTVHPMPLQNHSSIKILLNYQVFR